MHSSCLNIFCHFSLQKKPDWIISPVLPLFWLQLCCIWKYYYPGVSKHIKSNIIIVSAFLPCLEISPLLSFLLNWYCWWDMNVMNFIFCLWGFFPYPAFSPSVSYIELSALAVYHARCLPLPPICPSLSLSLLIRPFFFLVIGFNVLVCNLQELVSVMVHIIVIIIGMHL